MSSALGPSSKIAAQIPGVTVGGKTTFDLKGLAGPVYVLWITALDSDGRAHVNEVTATS